jgi:hypothetical protein
VSSTLEVAKQMFHHLPMGIVIAIDKLTEVSNIVSNVPPHGTHNVEEHPNNFSIWKPGALNGHAHNLLKA